MAENRSPRSKVRGLEQELRPFVGCLLPMYKTCVHLQGCKYKQASMTSLDIMLSSVATVELLLWQWISLFGIIFIYQLSWYLYKWVCWRDCKSWARKLFKASVYITGRTYFPTGCLGHKVILNCPVSLSSCDSSGKAPGHRDSQPMENMSPVAWLRESPFLYLSDLWMSRGETFVSVHWKVCWELWFHPWVDRTQPCNNESRCT